MKNKVIFSVLSVVIVILLVTNVMSYHKVKSLQSEGRLMGSYFSGDGKSEDTIYMAITEDNKYYLYKQIEMLEEGVCLNEYENIYSLAEGKRLIYSKDRVYYVDDKGTIIALNRFSETPVFINVQKQ